MQAASQDCSTDLALPKVQHRRASILYWLVMMDFYKDLLNSAEYWHNGNGMKQIFS